MSSNELAILEEFEQRFQRLENTVKMLIETDLHVRVAALEAKQKMVHMDEDSQFLGSVEGQEVESMLAPRPLSASSPCVLPSQNWNSSSIKSVDPAESAQIRRFFSEHTANSLVKQRASAASAASTQEMTSPSPIPPEHYRFVQSTFDLMMFVGTGHLGCLGAAQTVALVLFTIFMQALFFGFAMVNFLDPVVTDQTVSDALRWRRSSAHALSQYDPVVGLSLGERVCGGDKSLHLSGIQMSLFEEIKQYLRLDVQGIWAFFNGQTLCIVALLCWYMMVAKEIGEALALHRGILAIQSGPSQIESRQNPFTQIMHFKLITVSTARKFLSYILVIYRLIAAAALVYVGSYFLVNTLNVTELILNAVSLGIILDVDNYIFAALASSAGKDLVHYLEPLQVPAYKRFQGSDVKSAFMCLAVPLLSLWVLLDLLLPMGDQLYQVSEAMCGGKLNFIWAMDTRGITMLAPTNGSTARAYGKTDAIDQAGKFTPGPYEEYAVWVEDTFTLDHLTFLGLEHQISAGNPKCEDLAVNEIMLNYLRDVLGDWSIKSCEDAKPFCRSVTDMPSRGIDGGKGFLTRLLCSDTCGCSDPGGEFMYLQGCPVDQCRTSQKYNQKITEGTCDEKTAEELRNFTPWVSWVSDLHRFANATGPEHQNQQIAQVVANAMWENGCDFKGYLNSRSIPWGDCFEWSALFDWGFKNMAFFCPTTCGCNAMAVSEQDNLCPIPHAGGCAHATSSNPPVPGGPGGPSRPEGSPPTPGDPPSPPL